ncbi:hypothetical protein RB195_017361 [Necator americanus]|uniref:Reverse transcriptase domain-containing protein n=1 Tax=Necator americanus TaxID=51031 RepID=A0ABR1C4X1_NECAM
MEERCGSNASSMYYTVPNGNWSETKVCGEIGGAFNFAVDDIIRRTVEQCPTDVILAPSARPLMDLEYADDAIIITSSSAKLQHVVNLVSK